MPVKIDINKALQQLIDSKSNKSLIPRVREEFSRRGPKKVKQAIVQDMIKGISPVKGQGKWKRYSQSYKDVIEDKAAYRKVGSKVIRITDPDQVKKLNADFRNKQNPSKRISPVNLRLTGGLHKSLFSKTVGGFNRESYKLIIGFKNKLADIHNNRGAGKSKVVRRLLPTKNGESFNRRISSTIFDQVKLAVEKVVNQFTRQ